MGRRQHQPTPAVGITNKWTRKGSLVTTPDGQQFQAKSLRQAKRYFRTGRPGNDPKAPKASSRRGAYLPEGRH